MRCLPWVFSRHHLCYSRLNRVELRHRHHFVVPHIDGLVQDCSIAIANALEILQSCSKPSIYCSVCSMRDAHDCKSILDQSTFARMHILYIDKFSMAKNLSFSIYFIHKYLQVINFQSKQVEYYDLTHMCYNYYIWNIKMKQYEIHVVFSAFYNIWYGIFIH